MDEQGLKNLTYPKDSAVYLVELNSQARALSSLSL